MSEVYTWEPSDAALAARYGVPVERIVRFDTNTSPSPPEFIAAALAEAAGAARAGGLALNEYPDSSYAALTASAAAYAGVPPDEVIVGAGADEILDLVVKAWLPAGGAAAVPSPTYGMYAVLTGQRRARVVDLPRHGPEAGWALDVEALEEALPGVQVVWLCDPNNPTGAAEDPAAIERVLDAAAALAQPPLVVVDEAYHEFTGRTAMGWRTRYPHLLVVRTVSKAFGLAGVRVGWAVAARPTIARLERVRPPGSISTLSAALAARALAAPDDARARATALGAERDRLATQLAAVGWAPYPSVTNFLLVPLGTAEAASRGADLLLRQGLVPRTFPADGALAGHLRLTVRSRAENERLLAAISEP